jgi:hypothetical protein
LVLALALAVLGAAGASNLAASDAEFHGVVPFCGSCVRV